MSASPSLRISLRRKRSTRPGENSGSPVIKKKSPKLSEPKESPCTPKTRTSRRPSTPRTSPRSATRTSPRLSRGRSTDKSDNEEKSFQTPASAKWTHANEDRLRQPSPDMPFLSSQLGTQECEVVWDCDSPGFTKEDLKRMHGGGEVEGPERAVAIPPAPPRQLFPHTRSRLARASASSNSMAQLNDLLDLLSSRENAGRKKQEIQEEPPSLQTTHQPIVPPNDSHSEDSSSSESMVLPRPLGESASQPFEVAGVCGTRDTKEASLASDFDESVWGDDLNLGLCDISDSVLAECADSSKGRVGVQKPDTDKSRVPSETAEISSASVDMFDDDLFSESVILSTQAVEEAMTVTKVTDVSNDKRDSSADFSKKMHHELKNVILKDEENSRNIKKVENNSRNINRSELHTGNKLATNNLQAVQMETSTNSGILSEVNTKQKNCSSDSPPRRQVRRSFRFVPSPNDPAKGSPSTLTRMTRHKVRPVPQKQSPVRTSEARPELRKADLMSAFGSTTEKNNLQNTSSSNSMCNKLSNTLSVSCKQSAQVTRVPSIRRPLFRNSDTKAEETRHRGLAQGSRGPLVRSQSIGNARLATSSPLARRSNSSMEMDTSQDLEDDEFFKSLLSMLPEEEGGIGGNPTVPVSPITTDNRSWMSHSSNNSLHDSRHVKGKSVSEVRRTSNNDRRDSSHSSVQSVNNGSVGTRVVSQVRLRPGVTNLKVEPTGKRPVTNGQGGKPGAHRKPLDTSEGHSGELHTSDTFDDGLFEDDVLSLIDEVESQFGSQNAPYDPSASPQSSQHMKCTQDEIARKKEAALQRRKIRRQQCR